MVRVRLRLRVRVGVSETCESSSCVMTSSSPPRMKRSDWSRWLSVTKAVSAHPERILSSSWLGLG